MAQPTCEHCGSIKWHPCRWYEKNPHLDPNFDAPCDEDHYNEGQAALRRDRFWSFFWGLAALTTIAAVAAFFLTK